ncbi:MerR family transcriptional regulator [Nocardiopsis sp. HUAS JQ3]|uniref:MerR family transcriptional regulator n=1 Tax=Nocardiopsis sp. HUAS JQ3 TaxID=3061629 RepID=UPI0023A9ABCD|nr:MerR family transcriptional regulator [Nocardiopsis sp. HUAS JQ3]WDZ90224.1 MerR family transcriptional regulator [Nocardiopsis sp. HUAS JQ3]
MTTTKLLGIGAVSERTGVSVSTLRFYEQEKLFLRPVTRDGAGRRLFASDEVDWITVCKKLRSSGMPLPRIRDYVDLVRQGPRTRPQRLEILREHQRAVASRVAELQEAFDIIDNKVRFYAEHSAEAVGDDLWLDMPDCSAVSGARVPE